ncbi:MAG: tetratricopeptide repeat protein, partial [Xanthomonadales bacterium]|nr:tetratricopeptide repeat protein [Xanthomonadales bacterium]
WVPVSTGTAAVVALIGGIVAFGIQARIAEQRAAELEQVSVFQGRMLETLDPALAGVALGENFIKAYRDVVNSENGSEDSVIDNMVEAFQAELNKLNTTDLARSFVDDIQLKPALLAIEREFGEQPAVAGRLYLGIGQTYLKLGLFESAISSLQKASTLNSESLGVDHISSIRSLYWLGRAHRQIDDFDEAKRLFQLALDGHVRLLGSEHSLTLDVMANLSDVLLFTGESDEAERVVKEIIKLESSRRAAWDSGERSLEMILAVQRVGMYLMRHKRYSEAEKYMREALEAREVTLGKDDPGTLIALNELIILLLEQGRLLDAELLSLDMIDRASRVHGSSHFQTSIRLYNHSVILFRLGRTEEAEDYARRCFGIRQEVFGPEHPQTLAAAASLGMLLQSQGKMSEAESLYVKSLASARKFLDGKDMTLLLLSQRLASIRITQERPEEALFLLESVEASTVEVMQGRRSHAKFLLFLGQARSRLGKFSQAESSLLHALELFKQFDDQERFAIDCRSEIDNLYARWLRESPSEEIQERANTWSRRYSQ